MATQFELQQANDLQVERRAADWRRVADSVRPTGLAAGGLSAVMIVAWNGANPYAVGGATLLLLTVNFLFSLISVAIYSVATQWEGEHARRVDKKLKSYR